MAIEQYKKISEMPPNPGGFLEGIFPYVIPGTLENFTVTFNDLKNEILKDAAPKAFVKYDINNILTDGKYFVSANRNMMHYETLTGDILHYYINIDKYQETSVYGTTYILFENISNKEITIDLSGYMFLTNPNPGLDFCQIKIPAYQSVEIATKGYGEMLATTFLLSTSIDISKFVTTSQLTDILNARLAAFFTKTEINSLFEGYYTKIESDSRFAPINHTHSSLTLPSLTMQVEGTTKATYNGSSAATYNVTRNDLNVYSKTEVNNITGALGFQKPPRVSEGGYNSTNDEIYYTLYADSDSYQYHEIAGPEDDLFIYFYENSISLNLETGNKCSIFIRNIGNGNINLILNTMDEAQVYMTDVVIPKDKAAEVIILGYGYPRVLTHLLFDKY